MARRPTKAGSSRDGAAHRRKLFIDAYIANGRNATQAAIKAGFSEKTAYSQGHDLLKHPEVAAALETAQEKIEAISGLTVERTLQELAKGVNSTPDEPIKWSDKLSAIDKAMRHLGLYEKDNSQRGESLALQVVLVQPRAA